MAPDASIPIDPPPGLPSRGSVAWRLPSKPQSWTCPSHPSLSKTQRPRPEGSTSRPSGPPEKAKPKVPLALIPDTNGARNTRTRRFSESAT
jgi:hypothetical protein